MTETFGKKGNSQDERIWWQVFYRLSGKAVATTVTAKWEKQAENHQSSIYSWHGIGVEPK